MIVKLIYQIDSAGDGCNYQLYIDEDYLETLNIPEDIKDRISSLGVTINPSFSYFNRKVDGRLLGEIMCYRLKLILEKFWDFSYGLPAIEFKGYTRKLDDIFKNRSILIFFTCNDEEKDIAIWEQNIGFVPKFEFIADLNDFGFGVTTTDIEFVRSWLKRKKFTLSYGPVNYKQTAEYKMKVWFPDTEKRKQLTKLAKQHIDCFVIKKNFNIYIPEYAFIESFDIRRFETIVEMFKSRFDVELVMTLPMSFENEDYTILFPVCGPLNRNNVRGH